MTQWIPTRSTHTPLTPGRRRTISPRHAFLLGALLATTLWAVSELIR